MPETAAEVFDLDGEYPEGEPSPVFTHLHTLWRRGWLIRQVRTLREGNVLLFRLLPPVRHYARRHLKQAYDPEVLQRRFGMAYFRLACAVFLALDRSSALVHIAQQGRVDFSRGLEFVGGSEQGAYRLCWGCILGRLGERAEALRLLETALESAQGWDQKLELSALKHLAGVYQATGQPQKAVAILRRVIKIFSEVGDVAAEAASLRNLAFVLHSALGQTDQAIELVSRSIRLLKQHNLPQDASGATLVKHEQFLDTLRGGKSAEPIESHPAISHEQPQAIILHTTAVMMVAKDKRDEWR